MFACKVVFDQVAFDQYGLTSTVWSSSIWLSRIWSRVYVEVVWFKLCLMKQGSVK